MGVSTRKPWLFGLGGLLAAAALFGGAARVYGQAIALNAGTDIPGALVVFPKVLWDGSKSGRDTVIMLGNTQNAQLHLKCWYIGTIDGTSCVENNFYLSLTKQMPTSWRVSAGRKANPAEGLMAGEVPPVKPGFRGELRCIEVAGFQSDVPLPKLNALKGEAILQDTFWGQVSAYNAVAFEGNSSNPPVPRCVGGPNNGNTCVAGAKPGEPGSCCAAGAPACEGTCRVEVLFDGEHYAKCPLNIQATHHSNLSPETGLAGRSVTVTGELTLTPCSRDLSQFPLAAGQIVIPATLYTHDQHEVEASKSISVDCWFNTRISDENVFGTIYRNSVTGPFVKSRIGDKVNKPEEKANEGLLGVFEEIYVPDDNKTQPSTAAVNMHAVGARAKSDVFVLEDPRIP